MGPRGGRGRCPGDRQLQRLSPRSPGAPGGARGEPPGGLCPPGDHRQPQLHHDLDDPGPGTPSGPAAPAAGGGEHLPIGQRRRRPRHGGAAQPQPDRARWRQPRKCRAALLARLQPVPAQLAPAGQRLLRRGTENAVRNPQDHGDARAAGHGHLRAGAGAAGPLRGPQH